MHKLKNLYAIQKGKYIGEEYFYGVERDSISRECANKTPGVLQQNGTGKNPGGSD